MYLINSKRIREKAHKMKMEGHEVGIMVFNKNTGEVEDLCYDENEAMVYCRSSNVKDETLYVSVAVNLKEIV